VSGNSWRRSLSTPGPKKGPGRWAEDSYRCHIRIVPPWQFERAPRVGQGQGRRRVGLGGKPGVMRETLVLRRHPPCPVVPEAIVQNSDVARQEHQPARPSVRTCSTIVPRRPGRANIGSPLTSTRVDLGGGLHAGLCHSPGRSDHVRNSSRELRTFRPRCAYVSDCRP
jgi:hypothetical protein